MYWLVSPGSAGTLKLPPSVQTGSPSPQIVSVGGSSSGGAADADADSATTDTPVNSVPRSDG